MLNSALHSAAVAAITTSPYIRQTLARATVARWVSSLATKTTTTTNTKAVVKWHPPRKEVLIPSTIHTSYNHFQTASFSHSTAANNAATPAAATEQQQQQTMETKQMNLFTAINDAMSIALQSDPSAIVFGEDVAFGGVFRCSQNLRDKFGKDRVFNTPLSEQGIAGFAIGYAATGGTAICEIQFADYIFPAIDQIVNEMAKYRYRSGNQWNSGGVTVRTPCGAVGHGGLYHSQSPEAYLCHTPGLVVVMPSTPKAAKGLLLASIRSPDPVIFMEPKILYRSAIEDVPVGDYTLELGKANIVREGKDVTVIGWGGHMTRLQAACDLAKSQYDIECELIDLQTLLPWDQDTVFNSVNKTGKLVISHEAPITCGLGAELAAAVQSNCFWKLEAPIQRVCGYDTPFPLVFEQYYIPDELKNLEAIRRVVEESK